MSGKGKIGTEEDGNRPGNTKNKQKNGKSIF